MRGGASVGDWPRFENVIRLRR